jgi:hypothetical protein
MAGQVLEEAILLGGGLYVWLLDRVFCSNFSCDAGVLGSVDGVGRLLLLGIALVLTLGRLVIHLARCQYIKGPSHFNFSFPDPIKIYGWGTSL